MIVSTLQTPLTQLLGLQGSFDGQFTGTVCQPRIGSHTLGLQGSVEGLRSATDVITQPVGSTHEVCKQALEVPQLTAVLFN
jgi:hypothetical protein